MFMSHRVWVLTFLLSLLTGAVYAPTTGRPEPQEITDWVALAAHQDRGGIPPGSRITMQNWQQYQQYMPLGMIALFKGSYFWKMPRDVEIDVGPTVSYPLPKTYAQAN